MNDSDLKYIQRVLESNAPDEDRERAAQMVRDIRRGYGQAPAASAEPVAWFVDWPDTPERGHYLTESPADIDSGRRRALGFLDTAPVAAPARAAGSPRDWIEDAGHENGNYQCKCTDCGQTFMGHKRRVVCKVCAQVPTHLLERLRYHATDTMNTAFSRSTMTEALQYLEAAQAPTANGDALDAARWRYMRRKLCLTGNGDGTCAMHAINLPAAIRGWPEPGEVAEFCDAAVDADIKRTTDRGTT
ncbi:hypothetical protein WKR98_13490 [Pigmentiphaga sp. YJ18]|uniref:hypothetical protein n=1 Tax=Pigmentiphaga sp. YJ18 TaxID=3134907 RepID=UPI003115815A